MQYEEHSYMIILVKLFLNIEKVQHLYTYFYLQNLNNNCVIFLLFRNNNSSAELSQEFKMAAPQKWKNLPLHVTVERE